MKNPILITLFMLVAAFPMYSQISISATGNPPHTSAVLDLQSGDQGLLIPRMNTGDLALITSPAKGLLVFDTTVNALCYYSGTAWTYFLTNPTLIRDTDNDTKVETERLPDEDLVRIKLGGTDKVTFRPNRIEIVNTSANISIGENAGMNTTGTDNVIVGKDAGTANTTGSGN